MSECPVDNFRDAYPLLRRPFTPAAVKFKVQATWDSSALIVAYIDARLAAGRLNHVIPHKWSSTFEPVGKALLCRLTVDGITREDIGDDYQGKGLYSDALKRAAVHFGVGESLYVLPKMTLNEGNLLRKKKVKGKDTMILTPAGESHLRGVYSHWLEAIGRQAFGEPLDHGDVIHDEPEIEQTSDEGAGSGNAPDRAESGTVAGPPDANAKPSSEPLAELAQLVEEVGFSQEERDGLRNWIRQNPEVHTATAVDLLRDGNKAAVMAGVEFEATVEA
jgi:hypothetical protein